MTNQVGHRLARLSGILLLLCLGWAVGAAAQEAADIPPGHWAYEAVNELLSRGYLPLGEDRMFRGDEPVDRYTLASVVAQLLTEFESGRAQPIPADVESLRRLVDELRDDLVNFYNQARAAEGESVEAQQAVEALDGKVSEIILSLATLDETTGSLDSRLEDLRRQVANAQTGIENLRQQLAMAESGLGELRGDLQQGVQAQQDALNRSEEEQQAILDAEVEALRQEVAHLTDAMRGDVSAALAETGNQISLQQQAIQNQIESLSSNLQSTSAALASVQRSLQAVETDFNERAQTIEGALEEIRRELNDQAQIAAAQEIALTELQGLSREQFDELARRLTDQMAAQLNLTLVREERLERQLGELRAEFDSYRRQSEQELSSLRYARYTGPVAIALALIAMFSQ